MTPSTLGLVPHPEDDEAVLAACFVSPGFDFADFELELS